MILRVRLCSTRCATHTHEGEYSSSSNHFTDRQQTPRHTNTTSRSAVLFHNPKPHQHHVIDSAAIVCMSAESHCTVASTGCEVNHSRRTRRKRTSPQTDPAQCPATLTVRSCPTTCSKSAVEASTSHEPQPPLPTIDSLFVDGENRYGSLPPTA